VEVATRPPSAPPSRSCATPSGILTSGLQLLASSRPSDTAITLCYQIFGTVAPFLSAASRLIASSRVSSRLQKVNRTK
jgi:hypothetical protein